MGIGEMRKFSVYDFLKYPVKKHQFTINKINTVGFENRENQFRKSNKVYLCNHPAVEMRMKFINRAIHTNSYSS